MHLYLSVRVIDSQKMIAKNQLHSHDVDHISRSQNRGSLDTPCIYINAIFAVIIHNPPGTAGQFQYPMDVGHIGIMDHDLIVHIRTNMKLRILGNIVLLKDAAVFCVGFRKNISPFSRPKLCHIHLSCQKFQLFCRLLAPRLKKLLPLPGFDLPLSMLCLNDKKPSFWIRELP